MNSKKSILSAVNFELTDRVSLSFQPIVYPRKIKI